MGRQETSRYLADLSMGFRRKKTYPVRSKGILYLHVSKTGGTTIKNILWHEQGFRFLGHKRLTSRRPEEFLLTSVRNPYTRLHSLYTYSVSRRNCPFDRSISFEEFACNYPVPLKTHASRHFPGVLLSATAQLNGFRPDYVVRFERIESDLRFLGKVLGIPISMKHLNKNRGKPKFDIGEFTPAMIRRINEYFKEDFINFGYEMIDPDKHNQGDEQCS